MRLAALALIPFVLSGSVYAQEAPEQVIKDQAYKCWNPNFGYTDRTDRMTARITIDQYGSVTGGETASISVKQKENMFVSSVIRALRRCGPYSVEAGTFEVTFAYDDLFGSSSDGWDAFNN